MSGALMNPSNKVILIALVTLRSTVAAPKSMGNNLLYMISHVMPRMVPLYNTMDRLRFTSNFVLQTSRRCASLSAIEALVEAVKKPAKMG